MLKPLLLLSAVTMFAITFASGQGRTSKKDAPAPGTQTSATPAPDPMATAKRLYSQDCAMCHGDAGDGKSDIATSMKLTLPDWTDPKTLAGKPDKELFDQIRNGKDKMPPEEVGRAKDADVNNLILYLRSFSKPQPPAPAQ
jgi:mono/diheme cytochrome c family protein